MADMRKPMRKRPASEKLVRQAASAVAFKLHAVKLHAVINQPIAQLFGNLALELLKFGIDKFDDFACFNIDQMIVMSLRCSFVAGAAIAEIMAIKNACFFEQANSAVNRGNRNARIDGRSTLMQFFDVGMINTVRQHARNCAALIGDAQSTFCAKGFDVDGLVHWGSVKKK